MQEMRISQLVLDPTSDADSKKLVLHLSSCEHAARDCDQRSDSSC